MITESDYITDTPDTTGNTAEYDTHQNVQEMLQYFIIVAVLAGVCILLALVNLYIQRIGIKKKPSWVKKGRSSGFKREEKPVKDIKANFLFPTRPSTRPSTSMDKK